jgi:eukaryotic-like serine/threonine-protein kinase
MSQDENEKTKTFDQSPCDKQLQTSRTIESIDDFKILGIAGKGGQSHVYKAFDPALKRHVAIKVYAEVDPQSATRGDALKPNVKQKHLWLDEAQNLASFDNDGIAKVYSAHGSGWAKGPGFEEEFSYVVMEWIEGETFQVWIRRNRGNWIAIAKAFSLLAETLRSCHSAGIVHRDIKPDNILSVAINQSSVLTTHRFKLIDFGIAIASNSMVTDCSGTIAWMSPEHALSLNNLDGRSDLYSLGVMIYEALTERLPYQLDGLDYLKQIVAIRERIPAPPTQFNASIPRELERICLRLLETATKTVWI